MITSRRIIHAEGVINKRATDSSLEKINDAVLVESIFGRIFGFGDLEVLTAAESGIERLDKLRDAKEFKKAMLEAKHELELELGRPTMPPMRTHGGRHVDVRAGRGARPGPGGRQPPASPAPSAVDDAPTAPVPAPDDISASLARLTNLRDQGLITPEEYEAKRTELLSRL